jgi:cytochrome P450
MRAELGILGFGLVGLFGSVHHSANSGAPCAPSFSELVSRHMSGNVMTESTRRRLTDRQADTVRRLTDAAVEEARETGFDGLTVRGVARRAGVAPATAYTDALAYVDPYADIESFRRRDEARVRLVALVQEIMDERASGPPPPRDERDLLEVLMSLRAEDGTPRFSADQVTGMFISMMFAGHHTTSGTAAWTLIELLRRCSSRC